MELPSEKEIQDRAVEMGLAVEGGQVPRQHRAALARAILADQEQSPDPQPQPQEPPGRVLSTSTLHTGDGGYIKIVITHHGAAQ